MQLCLHSENPRCKVKPQDDVRFGPRSRGMPESGFTVMMLTPVNSNVGFQYLRSGVPLRSSATRQISYTRVDSEIHGTLECCSFHAGDGWDQDNSPYCGRNWCCGVSLRRTAPLRGGPGECELHAHRPASGDVVRAGLPEVVQREHRVEYAPQELDIEEVPCVLLTHLSALEWLLISNIAAYSWLQEIQLFHRPDSRRYDVIGSMNSTTSS